MMQYWINLPNKLCVDREAKSGDENKCWNGMAIDRYILMNRATLYILKAIGNSLLIEHKKLTMLYVLGISQM